MVSLKKLRLMVIAGLAASSFLFLSSESAWASSNPTGEGSWQADLLPDNTQISSTSPYSEARSGSGLLQVWRAADSSGNLWAAFSTNGHTGSPVLVGLPSGVSMLEAPVTTAYNTQSFQIAFTGTNLHIYRATFAPTSTLPNYNNLARLSWQDTGQTSYDQPSIAQLGAGSGTIGMVWMAANSTQNVVFATWNSSGWTPNVNLGGFAVVAPAISYNPSLGAFQAIHTGTTGQIYVATRVSGGSSWSAWISTGANTFGPVAPAIAASGDGTTLLAGVSSDGHIEYNQLDTGLNSVTGGWVPDNQGWLTDYNVSLAADGNDVNAIAVGQNPGLNDIALPDYFKHVYQP